jgi:hypothetical protein
MEEDGPNQTMYGGMQDTTSTILSCNVQSCLCPTITDHLPIITTLDLSYYPTQSDTQFNDRHADWENFAKTVQEKLDDMPILNNHTHDSTDNLESAVNELFKILQEVAAAQIPTTKPHPHLKCWWNKELTALRKRKNCASSKHYDWRGTPNHKSHKEY